MKTAASTQMAAAKIQTGMATQNGRYILVFLLSLTDTPTTAVFPDYCSQLCRCGTGCLLVVDHDWLAVTLEPTRPVVTVKDRVAGHHHGDEKAEQCRAGEHL